MLLLRSFALLLPLVLLIAAGGCGGSSAGIHKPDQPAPMPDPSTRINGDAHTLESADRPTQSRQGGR
jgi:hypothetical protein